MTTPEDCSAAVWPTTDTAVAAAHLDDARRGLDDVAATLRRAASFGWESPAADGCRTEIAQVVGALDAASGTVDQARLVARAAS